MSRRSSRRGRRQARVGEWNLIDDMTGFKISSRNAVMDYKGNITTKANLEHQSTSELPVKFPVPRPVPFTRIEQPDLPFTMANPYNMPATYLDHFEPQTGMIPVVEFSPATHPNMNFKNILPQATFGPENTNPTQTGPVYPTGPHFKTYGDSYDYFDSDVPAPYNTIDD